MAPDKYSALWISHTSLNDFIRCERAYYLKHVYKDPKTHHKIKLMAPPLALGQAVHEVIESLSVLPVSERFKEPLFDKYEKAWEKVQGKKGGFYNESTELKYKNRGRDMISRVIKNPGPIARKAVKIKKDLPYYWISEEDNIILCGKVDWIEYMPETNCVHIIDFKTSTKAEDKNSLQLVIYYLLVTNCQKRNVVKASYWYLENSDELTEKELPDVDVAYKEILDIAKRIKTAKQLQRFQCKDGGCQYCKPMEMIINGEAEYVYVDTYNSDVYIVPDTDLEDDDSEIL